MRPRPMMRVVVMLGLLLVAAAPAGKGPLQPLSGVHVEDGRFVDDQGRTVLLRGVNVIDKWRSSGDTDLDPRLHGGRRRTIA